MNTRDIRRAFLGITMIWAVAMMPVIAVAQTYAPTKISLPRNKYKVEDDVKLGRDYSVQVEQMFPVLNDSRSNNYVQQVGARLVAGIPRQFYEPTFQYRFQVVNASDINAFALPGGPMYVNRGMIEAARNEGEMAGVMAHEISHVALRHATAQATRQGSLTSQLGTIGMVLGGAILGGQTGAQLGMLGATAWMTKYSREYETQADILGAQIMANAGYDPRDLASMFETIAAQGGNRGPTWLSTHPDPGNRNRRINDEANRLRVSPEPTKMTRDFQTVQSRLRSMPPAKTMAQLEQEYKGRQGQGQSPTAGGRYSNNVPAPSTQTRTYSSGNWIRMNVPSNWREFAGQTDVTFAPEGAYGPEGITHGAMVGVFRGQSGGLAEDSRDFVNGLLQANNYLRQQSGFQNARVANRQAYSTVLAGRSPVNGRTEVVTIYTLQLRNRDTFYIAAVTPEDESNRYNNAFRNMINSIRLNDIE
jgi:Zn-dependent protease with chaperone function